MSICPRGLNWYHLQTPFTISLSVAQMSQQDMLLFVTKLAFVLVGLTVKLQQYVYCTLV